MRLYTVTERRAGLPGEHCKAAHVPCAMACFAESQSCAPCRSCRGHTQVCRLDASWQKLTHVLTGEGAAGGHSPAGHAAVLQLLTTLVEGYRLLCIYQCQVLTPSVSTHHY